MTTMSSQSESSNEEGPEASENIIPIRRREIYCGNCGEKGHVYRYCKMPITSFGLLAFRRGQYDAPPGFTSPLEVVLVRRKDTMGYVDLVRGRYPIDEPFKIDQIKTYLSEMTREERNRLGEFPFDALWDKLWVNHNCKCYKNEYDTAKRKFGELDIQSFLNQTTTKWETTEFGIPKGRRNMRETNIECAKREFCEETGYRQKDFKVIDCPSLEEIFTGTNGIRYKHVYYLAEVNLDSGEPFIDKNNKNQIGEIASVGWYNRHQALNALRDYDIEKKKVINEGFKLAERFIPGIENEG